MKTIAALIITIFLGTAVNPSDGRCPSAGHMTVNDLGFVQFPDIAYDMTVIDQEKRKRQNMDTRIASVSHNSAILSQSFQ